MADVDPTDMLRLFFAMQPDVQVRVQPPEIGGFLVEVGSHCAYWDGPGGNVRVFPRHSPIASLLVERADVADVAKLLQVVSDAERISRVVRRAVGAT